MSHKIAKKARRALKVANVDWKEVSYIDKTIEASIRNIRKVFGVKKINNQMKFMTNQRTMDEECGRFNYKLMKRILG